MALIIYLRESQPSLLCIADKPIRSGGGGRERERGKKKRQEDEENAININRRDPSPLVRSRMCKTLARVPCYHMHFN